MAADKNESLAAVQLWRKHDPSKVFMGAKQALDLDLRRAAEVSTFYFMERGQ